MLRNRKIQDSTKIKGVNKLDDESALELGEFTVLQNFIPADVYAIKKKRGTSPLYAGALNNIITEDGLFDIATEAGEPLITEI